MLKTAMLILALFAGTYAYSEEASNPPADTGAHYDWGRGRDGTGYCYQFTNQGEVLNGGRPVDEKFCEAVKPSIADWGSIRGFGYCYQFTPDHLVIHQGRPQAYDACEKTNPSYFSWGRSIDGWTYCYQFTPDNAVLNEGRPVPNEKCY